MGTNPEQVKGLVVEDAMPVFYTLRIDLGKSAGTGYWLWMVCNGYIPLWQAGGRYRIF